jgi:hypothetical protein
LSELFSGTRLPRGMVVSGAWKSELSFCNMHMYILIYISI